VTLNISMTAQIKKMYYWKILFCNKGKQNTIYTIFIPALFHAGVLDIFQNTSHVNTTEYNTIQMYKFPNTAVLDIENRK
jgi:hypothetical protein